MAPAVTREAARARDRHGGAALAVAYFLPPSVALLLIEVAYLSVPRACRQGTTLELHLEAAGALLLALGGVRAGWRVWSAARDGEDMTSADPVARTRFLAATGVLLGVLSTLVILAVWLAVFLLDPCA
jgi:hypothetical protein